MSTREYHRRRAELLAARERALPFAVFSKYACFSLVALGAIGAATALIVTKNADWVLPLGMVTWWILDAIAG
jgi:hypothetical protein